MMELVTVKEEALDDEIILVEIKEEGMEVNEKDITTIFVKDDDEVKHSVADLLKAPFAHQISLQCFECNVVFSDFKAKEQHMKEMHPEEYQEYFTAEISIIQCRICQRSFSSSWELVGHQCGRDGHNDKVCFKCPVCGDHFERPTAFIMHKRSHVGQSRYVCKECGKTWNTLQRHILHRQTHIGDSPGVCREQEQKLKHPKSLKMVKHEDAEEDEDKILSSSEKSLQCHQCFMVFKDQETSERHMRQKHPAEYVKQLQGSTVFACLLCDQTFLSSLHLIAHQVAHRKRNLPPPSNESLYQRDEETAMEGVSQAAQNASSSNICDKSLQCGECRIFFSDLKAKELHSKEEHPVEKQKYIAVGNSLFNCQVCLRSFSSSWELLGHECGTDSHCEKVHFKCPVCADRFERPTAFIMHKRSHVGQSRYVCTDCGKTWKTLNRLMTHRRTHKGERPHQCEECGRTFKQFSALEKHLLTHTVLVDKETSSSVAVRNQNKSLQCLQCFMTFRDLETTERHMRFKHPLEYEKRLQGSTVFACSVCDQTFPSSLQLSVHQRTHKKWSLPSRGIEDAEMGDEEEEKEEEFKSLLEQNISSNKDNTSTSHKCLHCHITFSNLKTKERHMNTKHPPGCSEILPRPPKGQPRPFCCSVCGERFIQEVTLREHLQKNHPGTPNWLDLWS
ncbi:zinc finger protein ZFP2-like isoform X1 [Erpetoichthys calabaricus]|uniref:Zinc finger protein 629-like n=1 Tax=Erpetoichthys calabaricus TaxID=27687 RepID=A0A8C4TFT6_ERPCA|nr:zinc finger protein ZFP2-like isoform X1 [Erpetoichthys calabaricus]